LAALRENYSPMKLGAFSVSLSVKDLVISKEFYEKLGFQVFGGSEEEKYLIMKNGHAMVGLFQGMFDGNLLTFNPGWNEDAMQVEVFDDVRTIKDEVAKKGIPIHGASTEGKKGPGSFMITDPDGNVILIDQHC